MLVDSLARVAELALSVFDCRSADEFGQRAGKSILLDQEPLDGSTPHVGYIQAPNIRESGGAEQFEV